MATYFKPANAGLASEPHASGRRIAKLLHALEDHVNQYIGDGQIIDEVRSLRQSIIDNMKAQGWRVYYSKSDRWQVLPPLEDK